MYFGSSRTKSNVSHLSNLLKLIYFKFFFLGAICEGFNAGCNILQILESMSLFNEPLEFIVFFIDFMGSGIPERYVIGGGWDIDICYEALEEGDGF